MCRRASPATRRPARFARGYYDRLKPAMREALAREEITRQVLEAVGREHQVCPFELSLDVSSWVDVIVCDYNYVFDPKVYLRRHFAEEAGDYAFLVDEAHNLVDRAREMFSADLDTREIQEVKRALKASRPPLRQGPDAPDLRHAQALCAGWCPHRAVGAQRPIHGAEPLPLPK